MTKPNNPHRVFDGRPGPGKVRISFSRTYHFSAAHRLHSLAMSDTKNREIYDKCNNLNGHGHDYYVEVTVCGQPDAKTGMIIPMPQLDGDVNRLLSRLDHKHLNNEVEFFRDQHSTGEVIIRYIWDELDKIIPGGLLWHIRLWETNNNYFEIGKEN
jgi:6-pyruvoyltetrahydropterin/6-carboxytetrahydropterin synthase